MRAWKTVMSVASVLAWTACGGSSDTSDTALADHGQVVISGDALNVDFGPPADSTIGDADAPGKDPGQQFDVPAPKDTSPQEVLAYLDSLKQDFFVEDSTPLQDVQLDDGGFSFPETTNDCEPLGFPNKWKGTFEGEMKSNIPDFAGYTFNGPAYGAIEFEIGCINGEYRIMGILEGGQTNCALVSGCPFVGKLWGSFNEATGEIDGKIQEASINYTAAIVQAAGDFTGKLSGGDTFDGVWSGEKTDIIIMLSLPIPTDWITASGSGTWEATAAE